MVKNDKSLLTGKYKRYFRFCFHCWYHSTSDFSDTLAKSIYLSTKMPNFIYKVDVFSTISEFLMIYKEMGIREFSKNA